MAYPWLVSAEPLDPAPTMAAARAGRRRARTRAAILDAAEVVFSREGYDGARIEEIAELADVSVGSIYSHFDGKRGMYLQLVDRALGLFTQYMERSEDPALSPLTPELGGGDACDRFRLEQRAACHLLA